MLNTCHHGEAFLWHGTGIDEIDDAIVDLVKLSEVRPDIVRDIADEILAILATANHKEYIERKSQSINRNKNGR